MNNPSPSRAREVEAAVARVLRQESEALLAMAQAIPAGVAEAVDILRATRGRVVVSGMGKSGHVARKFAATLASTGTPAMFLHPAEASHGDLGMVTTDDVCILLSNSGETRELKDLVQYAKRFAIPLIAITKAAESSLARRCNVVLLLPDLPEACAIGMAPTTSTTCALALGDAIAVALMQLRGLSADRFHDFHPGGKLGAQFLQVGDIMHKGDKLPVVKAETPMGDALLEMSAKGFGVVAVVENGRLAGVITDGDLRRNLEGLMNRRAGGVATRSPCTVTPETLVSEALRIMNDRKISTLFVTCPDNALQGIVHVHDCLRIGAA